VFKLFKCSCNCILVCLLGIATNASASSLTGSYDYAIQSQTTDAGCSSNTRDNFASTSGGNSINSSDTVTFSICDGTPGFLVGGEFEIDDSSADQIAGTFSGALTGTEPGTDGNIYDGTITVTTQTGTYSGVVDTGTFEVITNGPLNSPGFTSGTITLTSATPEPVTTALTGLGLILLSVSRRFLKRRT